MGTQSSTHPQHRRNLPRLLLVLLPLLIPVSAQTQTSISALTSPLILPSAVAFDSTGNLYIAETGNHVIRRVDPQGQITTIAGTGTQGFSGDNGPATQAQLDSPQGLALNATTLYIADTHNHRIRALNLTTNIITTIAGTTTAGFDGDSGSATSAHLNLPTALALDPTGNLCLADTANHRIRRIDATTHIITTIAGTGTQGYSGDAGPATQAAIDSPTGLAADTTGNLYLSDTHNHRIRRIDATTHIITTIAGTGAPGSNGDNAAATAATLALPHGLTLDANGNLYLSDTANHRIRRIDATTGLITTIAGTGTQGFSGDTGPATAATLDSPRTATISTNQLTLADTSNNRVRQLSSTSTINTIAGLGNTLPGTLTLTGPSVIAYGTGQLTATIATTATGTITFLDTFIALTQSNPTTSTLGTVSLISGTATLTTATLPTGTHTVSATYPGDLTHAAARSTALTLTINPAPTRTTLSVPLSSTQPPITLTAQTTSTTTGKPTGTLTLLDTPSTQVATATLTAAGNTTLLIPTLATGTHILTASYSGDANFQPSTSTPSTLTISAPTATPADFTLVTTGSTAQTIPAGNTATFTFNTQTQGPLSSPIVLSVSGLPRSATATFNPTLLPPGNTTNTFTLTITTPKATAHNQNQPPPNSKPILPAAISTLLLPLLLRRRSLRKIRAAIPIALLSLITLATVGCGDRINTANSQSTTQPQTYNITLTATATAPTGAVLIHFTTVTLTLQ